MAGEVLDTNGIPFEHQKRISRWCFDYFLSEIGLVVEIDGAFWHSSAKVQERDIRKNAAVADMGFNIIRLDAEVVRRDPAAAMSDVLARWQVFTGREAILESTGKTYAETAAERAPPT